MFAVATVSEFAHSHNSDFDTFHVRSKCDQGAEDVTDSEASITSVTVVGY